MKRSKAYHFKFRKYYFGYLYLERLYGIGLSIGIWYHNKKITFDLQVIKVKIYIYLEKPLKRV